MGESGFQSEAEALRYLAGLILSQRKERATSSRNEKIGNVLGLLARGAVLATVLAAPGTVRLFRDLNKNNSEWEEWKMFNVNYLKRTLRRLDREKVITVEESGKIGKVVLTEKGRRRVLKMGLESLSVVKPDRWDGKWRLVFYDVFDKRKGVRERFRAYLKSAGFYQLQESVYIHAYPCEKEIEFLRYFLGMGGEVRIVLADKIEDDRVFRDYFGV